MRLSIAAIIAGMLCAGPAAAQAAPPAQIAYVERQGLLDLDARCRLLAPDVRGAVQAGAFQAEGALLRSGWTSARLAVLASETERAARARDCEDARTARAVAAARAAFAGWSRTRQMQFEGTRRPWVATRWPDANGWRLRQDLGAPIEGRFGVRDLGAGEVLSFVTDASADAPAPASAHLVMRDPRLAGIGYLETPVAQRLPSPPSAGAKVFWARRRIKGVSGVAFEFPEAAFAALLELDPRETALLRLGEDRATRTLTIEIGDLRAARGFLAAQVEHR